jgi:hypothetical protein
LPRSSAAPDKAHRQWRETISTEGVQQLGIGVGIPLEPAVEIVAEAVVPV